MVARKEAGLERLKLVYISGAELAFNDVTRSEYTGDLQGAGALLKYCGLDCGNNKSKNSEKYTLSHVGLNINWRHGVTSSSQSGCRDERLHFNHYILFNGIKYSLCFFT